MKDFWNKIKDFFKTIWAELEDNEVLSDKELSELNSIAQSEIKIPKNITSSIEIGNNGVQKVSTRIPTREMRSR